MNLVERAAQAALPDQTGALKPLEITDASPATLCTPLLTTVTITPGLFAAGNMVSDFVGQQDAAGYRGGLAGKSGSELLGIRLSSLNG